MRQASAALPLGCAFPTITNSHVRGLTHALSALRMVLCCWLYSAVTVLITLVDATLWIRQPLQASTIATAACWVLCHTGVAVATAVQDCGRATDAVRAASCARNHLVVQQSCMIMFSCCMPVLVS
jgi:hypothetical protein